MPSGIIMQSGSIGAKQEDIQKVLEKNGFEVEPAEAAAAAEPVEPKREDFKSDEEFETAQAAFEEEQDKLEAAREEEEEQRHEEEERKRLESLPKKSRKQRAIERATNELKEENRKLAERLAALESGKKPATEAQPAAELKAPKREDFKTDEEFEDAKFDYRYKLRRAKEAGEDAQNRLQERLKTNLTRYEERKEEFKAEHDDWDDLMKENGNIPIHAAVQNFIFGLEDGPSVVYYLASHPDKARQLAEMYPDEAVMEVIRLHDRLKTGPGSSARASGAATSTKPKPKPRLPEPVTPVRAAAAASTLTSREAAQNKDYKAFKRAQFSGR